MLVGSLYTLASAFGYGLISILAKLAYAEGVDAFHLLQVRFTLAVPIMALILLFRDWRLLIPNRPVVFKAAFLGGLLYGIQSGTYFAALQTIPASTGALILCLYPIFVAALSALLLKQPLDKTGYLAVALVIGGSAFVFYDAFRRHADLTGILLALAAVISFSVYMVSAQVFLRRERPLQTSFWVIVFSAISFNLMAGPERLLDATQASLIYGGLLGLFSTVLAVTLLFVAIEKIGSTYASIFSAFEPVTTVTLAVIVLGETVVGWQIIGVALIIGGIILPNAQSIMIARRARRAVHRPPPA